MARQIAPETPDRIDAPQVKVGKIDTTLLDKIADDKIRAANNNFKLYAEALVTSESQKIYDQFKSDPVNLANALGKLPDMLSDLPEDIQAEMGKKIALNNISLVGKAQDNYAAKQDYESKLNANHSIDESKAILSETYQNILQNHISPAEQKNLVMNDIYLQQRMNLNDLADLTNSKGKYFYTDSQRKAIRNVDDIQLNGFKQFFDRMLLNDNENLEQTKDYYTKFLLAPDRFMTENYMNRETYDKARAYAKKELERAGADIKKARFNQSIREATELQMADLPGRIESLREAGLLDKSLINNIEKVNVKFNEIDPSKAESPIAMINMLEIIRNQRYDPAPRTEADQQKVMEQGTAALDAVADYAQTYGLSPEKVRSIRETIVNQETNTAFRPILDNFADIIDNFESKMTTVRNRATQRGGLKTAWQNLTNNDGMSNDEEIKLIQLNNLLATATDAINQQIRNGDWESVRATQKEVQKQAARIYYDWVDWQAADKDKDYVAERNGRFLKPKGYTEYGDVIFEILKTSML